jgi:hypothetical protein
MSNTVKKRGFKYVVFLAAILSLSSVSLLFTACNKSKDAQTAQIDGVQKAYALKLNRPDYDFLAGVSGTLNGQAAAPAVDVSAVDFASVGEYDIFFTLGDAKVESVARVYGEPEFFGENYREVTREQLAKDPTVEVGAMDSFGTPLPVTVVSGFEKDSGGQYPLGENDVVFEAVDAAGNKAAFDCKITVYTAEGYYGRTINGAANLPLWYVGDVARQSGSTVVWDAAEQAYRLDNGVKVGEVPDANYEGYSAFRFDINNTLVTFGSRWYDAIKFEWKRPAGPVADISWQGVGYRVSTATPVTEWQETILPFTAYNAKYWSLSFTFKTPADQEISSMYVKNLQLVKKTEYFADRQFNGKRYLALWDNAHLGDGASSVTWDEDEEAFLLTNGYDESADQGHGGFNFGWTGLLDTAWGTDGAEPAYDAIVLKYKQEATYSGFAVNFQGYPVKPYVYNDMTDWGALTVPLDRANTLSPPDPLGITHRFAALSFFAPCADAANPTKIWVKNIEFINFEDYTNPENGFNNAKYIDWWGFGHFSNTEKNGDTIAWDEAAGAWKFVHLKANDAGAGVGINFTFGGTAFYSLITQMHNRFGYDTVTFKVKKTPNSGCALYANSMSDSPGYEVLISDNGEWAEYNIKMSVVQNDSGAGCTRASWLQFVSWNFTGGDPLEFWVKDIAFSAAAA